MGKVLSEVEATGILPWQGGLNADEMIGRSWGVFATLTEDSTFLK